MGYVGWGLVAEQANTTTGGAQRTVGITSSPGAGIAQSSLNSVNNGGGGVVNNYGAVWDNLFVRQYLFGRGEQGAWFDPSDFQPNWRRNLLTWTEDFSNAAWVNTIAGTGVAATVTADQGTAPDGTNTADRIQFNLGGGTTTSDITRRRQSYVTPATTHTFSLYLRSFDGVSTYNMHLVSSDGSTVNIVVTGTWQRFVVTAVGTGSPVSYAVGLRGGQTPANSNTADVLVWGAQLEVGSTATAYQPITNGVQDYFTYQPQPILYQDSSGTTPVTALEQPCGLMLDKSKGLVLGSEQSPGLAAFTLTASGTWLPSGAGYAFVDTVGGQVRPGVEFPSTSVPSGWYRLTFTVGSITGATQVRVDGVGASDILAGTGTYTGTVFLSATSKPRWRIEDTSTTIGDGFTLSNVSMRSLSGNHAYQTTSAKRPVVSARVNLLTYTEQFDNAVWFKYGSATVDANVTTAPNGQVTADRINAVGTSYSGVSVSVASVNGVLYTSSVCVKQDTSPFVALLINNGIYVVWFNFSTGNFSSPPTGPILAQDAQALENGWYRLSVTVAVTGSNNASVWLSPTSAASGASSGSVFAWAADTRPADQATGIMPRYQRVGAATSGTSTAAGVADYDSVGFPVYLRTDGIDDAMLTNSIDFSAGPTNPPAGPELVTNGTFDSSTTGWAGVQGATLSVDANRLLITNGNFGGAKQYITLVTGRTYLLTGTYTAGTVSTGRVVAYYGNENGTAVQKDVTAGSFFLWFTGQGTNCPLALTLLSGTAGQTGYFDNISVREIDAAYAPDKVTVFTGVRKLSDAAQAVVTELSTSIANPGAFAFYAPSAAGTDLSFFSGGTTFRGATQSGFASPITAVASGIGNISGDSAILRVNGTQVASNTADQGTGNYGNYPLYLFARNQTSLYFTGNFYGLIVRGAQTDTSLITTTEEYIANVTGFGAPVVVGTPSIGVSI